MGSPRPKSPRSIREEVLSRVDPRMRESVERELTAATARPILISPAQHVVLVGHRAAGKTTLLPSVAELLGRTGVDTDQELERRHQRRISEWLRTDQAAFRAAERALFHALPAGQVVSAGGGFLSLHADLLAPHLAVLVPVSFETYRERLLADTARPRLRPELMLEEEIATVFRAREALHARVPTVSLARLLASVEDDE